MVVGICTYVVMSVWLSLVIAVCTQNDAPPLPPRSSGVLLPLGKNGAPANKLGKVLPASKSNIKVCMCLSVRLSVCLIF